MRTRSKSLMAWVLALAMLLSLLPSAAFASGAEEESSAEETTETVSSAGIQLAADSEIVASGTCGKNLTWTLDEDGVLTISGTGDMTNYIYSDIPWCDSRESIACIVIGDGVTSIGRWSFNGCTSLTSVIIPDSVTSIDGYAFKDCAGLTSVTIGSGVTSISYSAFSGCTSLAEIQVSEANTAYCSVGGVLFTKDMTQLIRYPAGKTAASYTISDSVTSIGDSAFQGCTSLTSITIPSSVTRINTCAFDGCTELSSISIPDSVTGIGAGAFSNCTALTSVIISSSVTGIGTAAFSGCSNLTDVYYSGDEDDWSAIGISGYNEELTSATIHYNSTGSAATFLFDDVTNEESWYYDAVYWAYGLGITEGYSDGTTRTFKPSNNCTRAEFTTFLYQLANAYGLENAGDTESTSFTDVTETGWYYTYVMWAAENGLVSGYSDGTFQPNKQITRAEAVTMLYGFYKSFVNGGQEPTVSDEASGFSDLSEDSWYYTYMLWATQNGVVSGYDDGTCRPNTNCTRSVMVVLLYATANHLL